MNPARLPSSRLVFSFALGVLQEDKTAVIVGTITDDVRLFEVPELTVVAMRVTETARARILGVRGFALWCTVALAWQCLLALSNPLPSHIPVNLQTNWHRTSC